MNKESVKVLLDGIKLKAVLYGIFTWFVSVIIISGGALLIIWILTQDFSRLPDDFKKVLLAGKELSVFVVLVLASFGSSKDTAKKCEEDRLKNVLCFYVISFILVVANWGLNKPFSFYIYYGLLSLVMAIAGAISARK